MTLARRWVSGIAILIAMAPAAALACPVCASRETDTKFVLFLVGAMIAVPYLVAAIAMRVIRGIQKADQADVGETAPAEGRP